MTGARPPVIVSLTTLPSRIAKLGPTLDSLRNQTLLPDRVLVCVPARSAREDREYVLPAWLAPPPPGIEVVRCGRDFGPGTKLLGCLGRIPPVACLIVVDDDMVYKPFLVERLYRAQLARRDASFSFFVYRMGGLRCGQGADGFSFWTPNLAGIDAFAEAALRSPFLFLVDDLWISVFLQDRGVGIESLQSTLRPGELVWERAHSDSQLSDLGGDLRRSRVMREGMRFLLASGLVGARVRGRYWLGCAVDAVTWRLAKPLRRARRGARRARP